MEMEKLRGARSLQRRPARADMAVGSYGLPTYSYWNPREGDFRQGIYDKEQITKDFQKTVMVQLEAKKEINRMDRIDKMKAKGKRKKRKHPSPPQLL
jgi:hypothetical protein